MSRRSWGLVRGIRFSAVVAITSLLVAGCDDNGGPLVTPSAGGPGDVVTRFDAVNAGANIALVTAPGAIGSQVVALTGAFSGFRVDRNDLDYAGFVLALSPSPAASMVRATKSSYSKSAESEGAGFISEIRENLEQDQLLEALSISFQTQYRGNSGNSVYNARVNLDLTEPVSVSDLRNRILQVIGRANSTGQPSPVTASANGYVFSLTVIETSGRLIVTYGLAPAPRFESLPQEVVDFNNGDTVVEADDELVANRESFLTQAAPSADILWVIDNSGSMSEEQNNVASGIGAFFDVLEATGTDFQLAVARTGPGPLGPDGLEAPCFELSPISTGERWIEPSTPNARTEWAGDGQGGAGIAVPGVFGSGNETGLFCAERAFLVDPAQTNAGFDRPGNQDIVVYVSDEPDGEVTYESLPEDADPTYQRRTLMDYETLFANAGIKTFGIVGPAEVVGATNSSEDPNFECSGEGGFADGGAEYGRLISLSGGARTSICAAAATWNSLFEEVALAASGGGSQFRLAFVPVVSSVRVTVGGRSIPRDPTRVNGFDVFQTSDAATLIFFGAARPTPGSQVLVEYDYTED